MGHHCLSTPPNSMPGPDHSYPSLECPKCGQRTIVKLSKTEYRCISCDFKRDFEKDEKDKEKKKDDGPMPGFVFALIVGVLLFLVL